MVALTTLEGVVMQKSLTLRAAALLFALIAVLAAGCSEESAPPTGGGTGGTVVSNVLVSSDSAQIGATVIVEATVLANGSPQAGSWVHFTVTPVSAGSFTADSAMTDASGIATTIFN